MNNLINLGIDMIPMNGFQNFLQIVVETLKISKFTYE